MELGRLTRITGLRDTWPDEARDFTPWLAQQENLAILSEHLGLGPEGLEKEAVEKFVGPYKADILCRDTTTGNWVLIENQLEKTDHSHLGQILVYAAGLNCKTVIWISKKITPEHKVAVEWLNRLATDGTSFYALEIELWRIGDSAIAPSFNTVVRPSEPARLAESAKSGLDGAEGLTAAKQDLFEYWQAFEQVLAKHQSVVRAVSPLAQNWLVHSIGKSGVTLNSSWNRKQNWVRAELYLTGPQADSYFQQLRDHREALEAALGFNLDWYDGATSDRRIFVTKTFPNVADRESWPAQHEWLAQQLEDLHRVFHDYVRNLK
ncbi:MAG: DUF4268 domain-containing protein [Albidovulum sp.]|uniref:DUF4268 domain-containing protein n=1 Tax=Albidovulum sp. TaxID=1872424 RepID=UPI003CB554A8